MYQRYLTVVKTWFMEDLDNVRRLMFVEGCSKEQIMATCTAGPRYDLELIYSAFDQGNRSDHRGTWNETTDNLLVDAMEKWGHLKGQIKRFWNLVASCVPPMCPKQCRERWNNQLDPQLDKSEWTKEDEQRLLDYVEQYGHRWADIQRNHYPKRSANFVKNQFYRLTRQVQKIKAKTRRRSRDSDPDSDSDNEIVSMENASEEDSQSDSPPLSPTSSVTEKKYATRSTAKPVEKFQARPQSDEEFIPEPVPQKRKLCVSLIDEDPRPQKRQRVTIDDPMFCAIVSEELQGLEKAFLNISFDMNFSYANYIDLTA